jgi:tetratricopeptide (TPR) repeat protein
MRKVSLLFPLLALILPLALYVFTLAPTYIPIDAAEFTMCVHFWGVCHPPGFPLYIILGKIFTVLVPIGTISYRVNLFSAVFGALTVLVIYLSLVKLKVDKSTSILVALIFAVSSTFWEYSLSADVFSFGTFLISLSIYLAILKKKAATFFLLGLSASHFYITAVLWPIFYWYLEGEKTSREQRLKSLFVYASIFALGFFPQAVMFWRMQQNPEINWGHASGISGFWYYLRRQEFGSIFLIANPALTFNPIKVFKHYVLYLIELLSSFGVILPVFILIGGVFFKLFRQREAVFLICVFVFTLFVQLFLLGTIDPTGADNPFAISKFYLATFIPVILLIGMSVDKLAKHFFEKENTYPLILLFLILGLYLLSNFKTHDYSRNRYTENLVLDGLSMLPSGSLVITVDHPFYFGGLYEQKVNGKFSDLTLLYFPNEKNRDSQNYHPEAFNRGEDASFVNRIKEGKKLGAAEEYVLSTISKNLDKPIYILQGSFEQNFFQYLKPYIEPYGLFWKVKADLALEPDRQKVIAALGKLRNVEIKKSDIYLKQQASEATTYAIAYNSTGVLLGSAGDLDGAKKMFEKSLAIDESVKSVADEIDLISKIQAGLAQKDKLIADKNDAKLSELGNSYFSIADYKDAAAIFEELIKISPANAQYFNNAASSYANLGQNEKAESYYKKALAIDPKLDVARQGLEKLRQ